MTPEPGRPRGPGRPPEPGWPPEPSPAAGAAAGTVAPAGSRLPAPFEAEVSAAVRYERGLTVKAVIVLAVLAVILLLRALYFA